MILSLPPLSLRGAAKPPGSGEGVRLTGGAGDRVSGCLG